MPGKGEFYGHSLGRLNATICRADDHVVKVGIGERLPLPILGATLTLEGLSGDHVADPCPEVDERRYRRESENGQVVERMPHRPIQRFEVPLKSAIDQLLD